MSHEPIPEAESSCRIADGSQRTISCRTSKSRSGRLGPALLAALVALGGVLVLPATVVAAAESDGSGVFLTRYGGADRYATSLLIAEAVAAEADGSLANVVLVSGERWADAVVAAPLAASLDAPVLMTPPDELRADALEFLRRMGVSKAVVVGPDAGGGGHGPGRGVSAEVFEGLGAAGISAVRVSGDDRFGTGVAAARRVTPGDMGTLGRTAVIASGDVFADALVAGPFAARGIHPVLLTPPGELHAEVASYLGDAGISHVVLMGGTAALSGIVDQAVEGLGISVSRVAGSTRYDTAVKAAELVDSRYSEAAGRPCFVTRTIGMARARVPFDSFSAAPLLGQLCAPLVLADPGQIPPETAALLDAARETHDTVGLRIFGGDAAVSQAAIDVYLTGKDPAAGEDDEAKNDSVVGVDAGESLAWATACRPRGISGDTTAGFPLPDWAPSALGTVRVAVLFVDFPDAQAAHSTRVEASDSLRWAEDYLEAASYDQLDVQFVPHHAWLRAPKSYSDYLEDSGVGDQRVSDDRLWQDAAALVDDEIDFSSFHSLAVILPSTHFSGGSAGGAIELDGVRLRQHVNNNTRRDEPVEPAAWGGLGAHELAHNLGLLDMYAYDADLHALPELVGDDVWVTVDMGLMGLNGYFIADAEDRRLGHEWSYADGSRQTAYFSYLTPLEMLAWSRWQLGWLTETQVSCVTDGEATVRLGPVASPSDETAMAAIPLNSHEVIVIESRRQIGYDAPDGYVASSGATTEFPMLVTPGVVVYTVDSFVESGELPVKFAGDSGNGQVNDFPVLALGESVTLRGYTITVTADDGDTHTVSITRKS